MAEQRKDIATRLKDLREIEGKSAEEMAAALQLPLAEYGAFEAGTADIPASALHDAARGRRGFDTHAEPRKDRGGGAGVLAFQEAVDRRGAIGQRSEHHRAVRHRLVAGDVQGAVQRLAGGGDPVLCHGKSLRVLRMEEIGGQSE